METSKQGRINTAVSTVSSSIQISRYRYTLCEDGTVPIVLSLSGSHTLSYLELKPVLRVTDQRVQAECGGCAAWSRMAVTHHFHTLHLNQRK